MAKKTMKMSIQRNNREKRARELNLFQPRRDEKHERFVSLGEAAEMLMLDIKCYSAVGYKYKLMIRRSSYKEALNGTII